MEFVGYMKQIRSNHYDDHVVEKLLVVPSLRILLRNADSIILDSLPENQKTK